MKPIRFAMLVSPKPEREKNALLIKEQIPELEIIHADDSKCDLFQTHIDVLQTDPEEYCGVVMMEDDLKLCKNFRQKFNNVMEQHSGDVVQFFERALVKHPLPKGWESGSRFTSTVCYYMPSEFTKILGMKKYIHDFKYDYFPKRHEPWGYPIDIYIAYVLGRNKMIYWREFPFLVQHLDFPSMFKGRSTKRQSRYFIDDMEEQNGAVQS